MLLLWENDEVHAHRLAVTIPRDHQIEIRLPEDFPAGPAEVIVLSALLPAESRRETWRRLEAPHPTLGGVIFHEDPSLPLEPQDWPQD